MSHRGVGTTQASQAMAGVVGYFVPLINCLQDILFVLHYIGLRVPSGQSVLGYYVPHSICIVLPCDSVPLCLRVIRAAAVLASSVSQGMIVPCI